MTSDDDAVVQAAREAVARKWAELADRSIDAAFVSRTRADVGDIKAGIRDSWRDVQMAILGARAALAAMPAGEVVVKPLEWMKLTGYPEAWDAADYRILRESGFIPATTIEEALTRSGPDTFAWRRKDELIRDYRTCPTLEAAKAAAQADYETRIRSALATTQPRASGDVISREKLVEFLSTDLAGAYDCTRVWEAWWVGTMRANDFEPVNDRIEQIADDILSLAAPADAGEPT
ncbi:MAG: hypothetical protein ACAH27_06025 [Xanthobacteraceae bacterium]